MTEDQYLHELGESIREAAVDMRRWAGPYAGHRVGCSIVDGDECDLDCIADVNEAIEKVATIRARISTFGADGHRIGDELVRETPSYAYEKFGLTLAVHVAPAIRGLSRFLEVLGQVAR